MLSNRFLYSVLSTNEKVSCETTNTQGRAGFSTSFESEKGYETYISKRSLKSQKKVTIVMSTFGYKKNHLDDNRVGMV